MAPISPTSLGQQYQTKNEFFSQHLGPQWQTSLPIGLRKERLNAGWRPSVPKPQTNTFNKSAGFSFEKLKPSEYKPPSLNSLLSNQIKSK